MNLTEYIQTINRRYQESISREHNYRGDLQSLLESLTEGVTVNNDPAMVDCGSPDYILTKKGIPVGYIEAKDAGANLDSKTYKEQFDRYKDSLDNLIITNYLDFQLYKNGGLVKTLSIGQIEKGKIKPVEENFDLFKTLIQDFVTTVGQTITSAEKLSVMMAGKAKMMKEVFHNTLEADIKDRYNADTELQEQFNAFKNILIHDITAKDFADIYAQTIAYGMFAARLEDNTLENFSRQKAANLIPKSNPFLRKLFQYIAGFDLDERLRWIVDDLAEVFRYTNVAELLKDFGKEAASTDPIIHFYETFLAEYDPNLRKSRGVWYTPEPVVDFIVRSVDDILKSEFDLKDGLADTTKTTVRVQKPAEKDGYKRKNPYEERDVHKVQILDPAAGTGTFLEKVIEKIYQRFEGQQGVWSQYVDEHLLPRIHGFEILMASYAMAHLKLDLLLKQTGYRTYNDQRFRVYLTNALEEHHQDTETLFANWLSQEANEANKVKRDTPVMVVLGNPPYSVSSVNKGEWIEKLINDYKINLEEKNINPLSDDYIKFFRFSQHLVDKNNEGIIAFISNNSYLDGIIHRKMRKSIISSFQTVYVVNLHGNAKRKEKSRNGSVDENVFDIQQGTSIVFLIKNKNRGESTSVYYYDLVGSKEFKYKFLNENDFSTLNYQYLKCEKPYFFFIPRNYDLINKYDKGFSLKELFSLYSSGIKTTKDDVTIKIRKEEIKKIVEDFKYLNANQLLEKYIIKETGDWKVKKAQNDIIKNKGDYYVVTYRPFDNRYIYMTSKSGGFIGRPRLEVMKHFMSGPNIGLVTSRQQSTFDFQHAFLTKNLMESGAISLQTKEWGYTFPLFIYRSTNQSDLISDDYSVNFQKQTIKTIEDKLGLRFEDKNKYSDSFIFGPYDLLHYIYSVLYSPKYRYKYKDLLKIDFPKIPYPKEQDTFWKLVELGGQLRQIHLLESEKVEEFITTYPKDGDNVIRRKITKNSPGWELTNGENETGRVWINDQQYFDHVPKVAWEFYIGGYQPAQKWLKERKDRELSLEDIMHYQKIIVALTETDRLMKEIDKVAFE